MRAFRSLAAIVAVLCAALPPATALRAQNGRGGGAGRQPTVEVRDLDVFDRQRLWKQLNDLQLFADLSPEMVARKVSYEAQDGMTIPAYLFMPRDTGVRRPVVVLVHGGVHADLSAGNATDVRILVRQGYIVVAPEYRGSTGYGRAHFDAIDYGGKEVEDCISALDYVRANVPNADLGRAAIMGFSHGGFISLHAIFRRPELFKVAVAHVPVADLPTRMRMHDEAYRAIFAAQPGFGGSLEENPRAYTERSPSANARKLRTPVLVHTADNDEDVFIQENHILRDSMVAAGKDKDGLYTYKEYHNPPGGHSFSRADSWQARESWRETMAFLRRHLQPERAVGGGR